MVHNCLNQESRSETFAFKFSVLPLHIFTFDQPVSTLASINRPLKRCRALSDVDGDGNEGRKKRRLRLHLITSRLSRPFSQPASNIVTRGMNKIPVWGAKHGMMGKSLLRKAAIMNRIRRRIDAARDFNKRLEQDSTRERLSLREIVIQKPRYLDISLPPSPLGVSNYDAFDLEDEEAVEDEDGNSLDGASGIYSDFNIMNPIGERNDDDALDDYLDALDGISHDNLHEAPPPPPPEECIVEMLKEDQQGLGFFVQIRD